MSSFWRIKQDDDQFNTLINAISSGGSGGRELSQIYRDVKIGIGLNGNAWETISIDTITIPEDGYYFVNASFQNINGLEDGMLTIRILSDNVEMLNDESENGTRASVSFNSSFNLGVQSKNIIYLTQGVHTFNVQAYSSMGTNPIGLCTFDICK